MGAQSLPLTPAPLTVEQAEAMSRRQIKKHHVAIMLLHWFNAVVWLFELSTGAALIASPYFRVAPYWYINMVTTFFGSRANMLRFHIAVGVTWVIVFAVYVTFGFRTYVRTSVLHGVRIHEQPAWRKFLALQCILFQNEEVCLDADDVRWLKARFLRVMGRNHEPLPPQGLYNAGQKLFAWLVYLAIPVIMLTGLVMALHLISTMTVAWAVVLHFVAVGLVLSGLMIHVYMGAVFPEEKPAFFSMITGMVSELYAYRHHFKWWREVKMQEEAWKLELQGASGSSGVAPPVAGAGSVAAKCPLERTEAKREGAWTFKRIFRAPEYWPPYVAGAGLGLTLLATFVLMGQGLGASGAFTRYLVAILAWVAPNYAAHSSYWSNYVQPGQSPLIAFLVFEIFGAMIGGFVSGWLAGRVRIAVDKGPRISRRTRYALALGGGILTGYGARLARGCTSGLALSGGAVLAVGAWVFMLAVFAAGFIGAYFMRRYWL
ncbi:MAG: YeeE/YedE family protein [Acidobacteria bacterium]|nr:YeeE/YedE family protein [Acidobacteriota bacterium]